MSHSLFTRIIAGEIPSYKIYEDELTYAFLAKEQVKEGHTLIVPKVDVDYFLDVPEPYYAAVFQAAKKVGRAVHKATDCKRVGTAILGWDVPHFHYHLIPMWGAKDLDFEQAKELTQERYQEIQKKIQAHLEE